MSATKGGVKRKRGQQPTLGYQSINMAGSPSVLFALSITLSLALVSAEETWMTQYHKDFQLLCPNQGFITGFKSVYDNEETDRVWNITCTPDDEMYFQKECLWTDFLNDFDRMIKFTCPDGKAIGGFFGTYSAPHHDRRFKALCCQPWFMGVFENERIVDDCEPSGYVNVLGARLDYTAPEGRLVTGIRSFHTNPSEDRRFQFTVCQ